MKQKSTLLGCLFLLIVITFTSCSSYKKVPYLQDNSGLNEEVDFLAGYKFAAIKIQPEDVLVITVNAGREPGVAAAFNLPTQPSTSSNTFSLGEEVSQGTGRHAYQVTKNGSIDFPVLGTLKVGGKTREELEVFLKNELKAYIKDDPIVSVRLLNFKISVLGEVNRPGQYTITADRINVLEALAMGGDMTIYGMRDGILVIREQTDGSFKKVRLDVSSTDIISSPYFYLQQNDVVYVQPNKAKAQSSDIGSQTNIWMSLGSIVLSLASLIVLLVK